MIKVVKMTNVDRDQRSLETIAELDQTAWLLFAISNASKKKLMKSSSEQITRDL